MKQHCYEKMILLIVAMVIGFSMIELWSPGVGCHISECPTPIPSRVIRILFTARDC